MEGTVKVKEEARELLTENGITGSLNDEKRQIMK